jgi:hypothetical protein
MPTWQKDKLLRHPPDLPLDESRYQRNIRTIRKAGSAVPSALADTLDPPKIELAR